MGLSGSSPHTRGALLPHLDPREVQRIIPAYAGSTSRRAARGCRCPDHPRIRGEHISDGSTANMSGGSSPHTRGARRRCRRSPSRPGIIPAYAGSTVAEQCTHWASSDHPRIRGEHYLRRHTGEKAAGSSPHTRGAQSLSASPGTARRIIPAYAGSTGAEGGAGRQLPDHPRIRGEHMIAGTKRLQLMRIIPAYAGSTRIRLSCSGRRPGSSPHTRGARGAGPMVPAGHRIIPAYAGST